MDQQGSSQVHEGRPEVSDAKEERPAFDLPLLQATPYDVPNPRDRSAG
jgi:hypothetical protein